MSTVEEGERAGSRIAVLRIVTKAVSDFCVSAHTCVCVCALCVQYCGCECVSMKCVNFVNIIRWFAFVP